ncbi:hypothetical protein Tco_1569324 [Tanacetum coccineum]
MTGLDNTLLPTPLSEKLSLVTHHHLLTRVPLKLDLDNWNFGLGRLLWRTLSLLRKRGALSLILSRIIRDLLKAELRSIKLGDQSTESYFQKIDSIVNILTSLDARVNEEDVVHYAFEGLPDTYNQVCGYMHWKDTFPDLKAVRSLLIAEEMRLKSKVLALLIDSSSHMVLVAETSTNSRSSMSQEDGNLVREDDNKPSLDCERKDDKKPSLDCERQDDKNPSSDCERENDNKPSLDYERENVSSDERRLSGGDVFAKKIESVLRTDEDHDNRLIMDEVDEDLEWDEIGDIRENDEKHVTQGGSLKKDEVSKRLNSGDDDEDLSWDTEDDDDDEPVIRKTNLTNTTSRAVMIELPLTRLTEDGTASEDILVVIPGWFLRLDKCSLPNTPAAARDPQDAWANKKKKGQRSKRTLEKEDGCHWVKFCYV